jgi:hypothetical protein
VATKRIEGALQGRRMIQGIQYLHTFNQAHKSITWNRKDRLDEGLTGARTRSCKVSWPVAILRPVFVSKEEESN